MSSSAKEEAVRAAVKDLEIDSVRWA
jgi:hypothetical protein